MSFSALIELVKDIACKSAPLLPPKETEVCELSLQLVEKRKDSNQEGLPSSAHILGYSIGLGKMLLI